MTELQQQAQNVTDAFPAGIKLSEEDFANYANLFALRQTDQRQYGQPLGTYVEALQNAVLEILSVRTYERKFKDYAAFARWLQRSIRSWSKRIDTETIDIEPAAVPGRPIRRRRPVTQEPLDDDSYCHPTVELTTEEAKRRSWNLRNTNALSHLAAIRSLASSIRGVSRRSRHGQEHGVPYRGCGGKLPEISPCDLTFSLRVRYGIETLSSLVRDISPIRQWTHISSSTGKQHGRVAAELSRCERVVWEPGQAVEDAIERQARFIDREQAELLALGAPIITPPKAIVKGSKAWYQEEMKTRGAILVSDHTLAAVDSRSAEILSRLWALSEEYERLDMLRGGLRHLRREHVLGLQHVRAAAARTAEVEGVRGEPAYWGCRWCRQAHLVAAGHDRCFTCRFPTRTWVPLDSADQLLESRA